MRFFENEDGQRAILSVIAAKPTRSITNPELRSAVADVRVVLVIELDENDLQIQDGVSDRSKLCLKQFLLPSTTP